MKIYNRVQLTNTEALSAGSLFTARFGGDECWGVLLDASRLPRITIAVLKQAGETLRSPYWIELRHRSPCLSFGHDCILEPIVGVETTPGMPFDHGNAPGVLSMGSDGGLVMLLRPFDAHEDEVAFDFTNNQFSQFPDIDASRFRRWRIWQDEESRTTIGASPLIDFDFDRG